MESRICGSDRTTCMFPDKVFPPTGAVTHIKDMLTVWGLKDTSNYPEPLLVPRQGLSDNQGMMEPRFHGSEKTASPNNQTGHSRAINVCDGRPVTSISCLFDQKELFKDEELRSKGSSSVIDTGSQNTSCIDLKLARFTKSKDVKNDNRQKATRSSLSVSPTPAKKIRSIAIGGQIPYCQVHGCNRDLRSSKYYHKKHKVCETHSKAAKVIVNGIEQRFCQQCSRFHLLIEFDAVKRSCRRRLAGHNERRRKPQLDTRSGRTGTLLQSYYDGRLLDASLPDRISFHAAEVYPNGILHELEHANTERFQHVKLVDDKFPSNGQISISTINGQMLTKPFHRYSPEKQFSSMHNIGDPPENISYENGGQIHPAYAANGTNVQAFPRVRESVGALSLLSSQSKNACGYSYATPMIESVIFSDGQTETSVTEFYGKPLPVIPQSCPTVSSNVFPLDMNSGEDKQIGLLVSDASSAVNFEFQKGAIYHGLRFTSTEEPFFAEPENTVNLIQLSCLLQRAEEERISAR